LEILKTDILSFFDKNLMPIWNFMNLKRLQTILGSHLKEIQNIRDTINEIFAKAIDIIFRSIKGEADDGAVELSPKI